MDNAYLALDHLSVGYNKVPVIEDINLRIKKGEVIALIGPNGAGKSTILKTIVRDLEPVSGTVHLEGKPIKDYSYKELSRKMAVILTERIKVELMTCRDIVATGRYPYTGRLGILTKADEQKVYDALETVDAVALSERDFNAISDGQKQRILLARAICQEPEIILLDEPTSFLDVRHKLELLSILTRMARKKNITVITSLHEIDLAEKVADRIVTVKGRDVFGFGTPEEIFDEERIRKLYDIDNGFFDPMFGSIELQKPVGEEPRLFILAGNGSGIPVYRELQQKNIPFATGILFTNDVDYRLARLLAAEVIEEKPFGSISDESFERAKELILSCEKVIDAGCEYGESNGRMKELLEMAEKEGKLLNADAVSEMKAEER
ncbi:MAG: ABC transporter ATP-binding protein [Lachnospiraceae bacterium]|nr:ABC transporter ATP-binding protein [Lachnospiraceae bacterium]